MSRIAKTPIIVPTGVEVKIDNGTVTAKGPKGELSFVLAAGIELVRNDGALKVQVAENKEKTSEHLVAMSGTTRAMINNLVKGVASGFEKKLTITGIGYRAQAQGNTQSNTLTLSLGFSHPVVYRLPDGVTAQTPTQTEIILSGADKQAVGQAAAEIRNYRPPEPYKGKGVRYVDEHVVRKQAKKK
ncbi:50S ribosomal protein L6 [Candidatus Spongiihabitans sp.]|uniref:50S ribosomal protein L6 n=1 Tax=Candidatus Spongiihabitans sp. TaxID=3101308 RepID=UPI003C7B2E01